MPISSPNDLVAVELAREYRRAVYALLEAHPKAARDLSFAGQLRDAASGVAANIVEGFGRRKAGEFRQFLRYASASLREAQEWLLDGVDRRHYPKTACDEAYRLGVRAGAVADALFKSLEPFTDPRRRGAAPHKYRPKSSAAHHHNQPTSRDDEML